MTNEILVLGLGNYIMMDEGVGVHAINALQSCTLPANVDLLDGGTGGVYLIGEIQDYKHIILIDAALDSDAEGTIKVIKPKYSSDYPVKLSAHEFGLKDMIDSMTLLGVLPEISLITVSVKQFNRVHIGLSPNIEACMPQIIQKVFEIIDKIKSHNSQAVVCSHDVCEVYLRQCYYRCIWHFEAINFTLIRIFRVILS